MKAAQSPEKGQPQANVDIAKDINKIHEYFDLLNMIVGDKEQDSPGLDGLLTKVLERHEGDFFNAFNTHMAKVKKELEYLKNKAEEQEEKNTWSKHLPITFTFFLFSSLVYNGRRWTDRQVNQDS